MRSRLPCGWRGRGSVGRALSCLALAAAVASPLVREARAISIELKDVAPDRIERQRRAVEGKLPLPNTPDVAQTKQRLDSAGLKSGAAMMMRIFKDTSELEIWLEKGDQYVLFATYPICHWSGTLGPKLREGDKQTPEGFYTISAGQLRHFGRWQRAINVGFPNAFDAAHGRNGSYILMHGGCSSVGCFAMTNPVIAEVHSLAQAAVRAGQRYIPLHIFPFRPTPERLAEHAGSPWHGFWTTLASGYASFDRTRRPPRISVCKGNYLVEDAPGKLALTDDGKDAAKRRGRRDIVLGAIRTQCPDPVIATTGALQTEAARR